MFSSLTWKTCTPPPSCLSPDRSPFLPEASQHRSCYLWSWSSSSTSSWGRCSRPPTSARATGCSCWARSPPSRWPCTAWARPAAGSPAQATTPAPPWHWWQPDGPAEQERKYLSVSQSVNISSNFHSSVHYLLKHSSFPMWVGWRGLIFLYKLQCLYCWLMTHETKHNKTDGAGTTTAVWLVVK